MKMIAISLSSECVQQPRCTFCYQGKEYIGYGWFNLWNAISSMSRAFPGATLAFEYNGHNLGMLLMHFTNYGNSPVTITTMPSVVTKTFCGAVAKHGVSAIALSYDSQKVKKVGDWISKARMIKKAGMKVSCNFLLEYPDGVPEIPREMLQTADQLNLLALKPTGRVKNRKALGVLIEYCKGFLPVALDNCLGYQLGYTKHCGAGVDFCHIRPDGKVVDCCFEKDCYIWLKKHANKIAEEALSGSYYTTGIEAQEYLKRMGVVK